MSQTKKAVRQNSGKGWAALTLVVFCVVLIAFFFLGIKGTKLDKEGLYKLLPWVPTPYQGWQEAIKPSQDFGATELVVLTPQGEASPEDLAASAQVLRERLTSLGLLEMVINQEDGKLSFSYAQGGINEKDLEKILQTGAFTFEDGNGNVFLTDKDIAQAGFYPSDETMQNFALSFQFDEEGGKVFTQKSEELIGQNLSITMDGVNVVTASVGSKLEGGASIPGFTYEDALLYTLLMRSGRLPVSFEAPMVSQGTALMGENAQAVSVYILWGLVLIVALAFTVRYRLTGFLGGVTLLCTFGLSWFAVALLARSYSVTTIITVLGAMVLSVYGIQAVFGGMESDMANGRSAVQAMRSAYKSEGMAALEVHILALLLAVGFIIFDAGAIGLGMRLFAVLLVISMVSVFLILRLLVTCAQQLLPSSAK
jgi:preprotein translocase subunit SecD